MIAFSNLLDSSTLAVVPGITHRCAKCQQVKYLGADFPRVLGRKPSYCKPCQKAAEKAAKARPAAKTMERERSRLRMREKRQANDDALRFADLHGVWVHLECHAYIPSPVEEIEARELWEEFCKEVWPLNPHEQIYRRSERRAVPEPACALLSPYSREVTF